MQSISCYKTSMKQLVLCMISSLYVSTALADGSASLSCGPADGSEGVNQYVSIHSPGYPSVRNALDSLQDADPFEAAIPLTAVADFMQIGLFDIVLPGLALACSYDLFEANECGGLPFMPNPVSSASLIGETLRYTTISDDAGAQLMWNC